MIRTVTGEITPEELGRTLIHEHIICTSPDFQFAFPDWLPKEKVVEIGVAKLRYMAEKYQLRTFVDGTPISLGRDLALLREVSEKSGVQIIASSGFYHYPCFTAICVPPETMARFIIDEVNKSENGINILKCAVDADGVTPVIRKYLETIAFVHRETGLPVFMHSHSGNKTGLAAQEILAEKGVPPEKTVVGHVADSNSPDYALELLERGCYVSVDRIRSANAANRVEVLYHLLRKGCTDRIMVSCDHVCCWDTVMNQPPVPNDDLEAMGVIFDGIFPALEARGIAPEMADKLTKENVINFFS